MNTLRISLVAAVLALSSVAVAGCNTADADTGKVAVNRLHYKPRVLRADLVEAGARCSGNLCTLGRTSWDCTGGGYCSPISE